ncbi:hypothetical protein D4765_15460 [Subtercola vilae]|uniref:Uncharacterized protein n=2 Tax=Subtercola vilae TaxID=2056433 RepID=A0A4T2BMM0_9MICO|nr:hypothetical protein D4765_15460 [Subtercola vilae]
MDVAANTTGAYCVDCELENVSTNTTYTGFDESSRSAVNGWVRDHRTAHRIKQGLDDAGFGIADPMTNGWPA